jgi:hypothetical protein
MRLVKALDAILTIIAFGRKQLCDLEDAACRAGTTGPRTVKHAFPNPELMIAQVILRQNLRCPAPGSRNAAISVHVECITEIGLEGIVLPAREAASPSAATLFLLEEGK